MRKQYTAEYILKATPTLVWEYITTSTGLSDWYCDDVKIQKDVYVFFWKPDYSEEAVLVNTIPHKEVKYDWLDTPNEFLKFNLEFDDLTSELSLLITFFADENEHEDELLYWNQCIKKLHKVIG